MTMSESDLRKLGGVCVGESQDVRRSDTYAIVFPLAPHNHVGIAKTHFSRITSGLLGVLYLIAVILAGYITVMAIDFAYTNMRDVLIGVSAVLLFMSVVYTVGYIREDFWENLSEWRG